MCHIKKQKFLAELGRLLTFMYEEDRQTALDYYDRMFDETEDQQGLISNLISPTRQAVLIARAYDAKERKLQVHSQMREDGYAADGEMPKYLTVLEQIRAEALSHLEPKSDIPPVSEDQISLFEAEPAPAPELAAEVSSAPAETGIAQPPAPAETAAQDDGLDAIINGIVDSVISGEDSGEEAAADTAELQYESPASPETLPQETQTEPADEGFQLPIAEFPAFEHETETIESAEADVAAYAHGEDMEPPVRRKAIVGLLIPYIILSIPIALILIFILLSLSALFLSLGLGVGAVGICAAGTVLSGFAVFADTIVVAGAALVIFAVALLLVWMFVWLIGGAVVGLIRGLVHLGGSLCYKEVPCND